MEFVSSNSCDVIDDAGGAQWAQLTKHDNGHIGDRTQGPTIAASTVSLSVNRGSPITSQTGSKHEEHVGLFCRLFQIKICNYNSY